MRRRFKICHRIPSVIAASVRIGEFSQLISAVEWNPHGSVVFEIGLCYSTTNTVPDLTDTVVKFEYMFHYTTTVEGVPNFYLDSSYTRYFRMYVRNVVGYAWSDVMVINPEEEVDLPSISTVEPFNIYSGSAKSGGIIANDGGGAITAKGVCWNTTGTPTTDDSTSNEGTGTADYESRLTPLNPSTLYYVRAYATNSAGTAYGQEETLTTAAATIPTVLLYNATDYDSSQIRLWGRIIDNGGSAITSKGFVWNLTGNPTQTSNFNSGGSGDADFNVLITGLPSGVIIYMRAVAQNSSGWGLGYVAEVTLSAEGYPPTVTMGSITNVTPTHVTAAGEVTDDGSSTISERGFVVSLTSVNSNPQISGTGVTKFIVSGTTGAYSGEITGLTCGSDYSINSYAMNAEGVGYGSTTTVTTGSATLPVFGLYVAALSPCGNADLITTNTYDEAVRLIAYLQCVPTSTTINSRRAEDIDLGYRIYAFAGGCALDLVSCYRVYIDSGIYKIIHIDANGIIDLVE